MGRVDDEGKAEIGWRCCDRQRIPGMTGNVAASARERGRVAAAERREGGSLQLRVRNG